MYRLTSPHREWEQHGPPKKYPVRTAEVECIPSKNSYYIDGFVQRPGDRVRMPLGDARGLEKMGKAKIVPNSERTEML